MITKFKINLVLLITSIIIPYLSVIFFIRTASMFIILVAYLFAFIVLIISTIEVRKLETNYLRRKYYWPISCMAVIIFFFSYGLQLSAADWMFFKFREAKLTQLVTEIKSYKKVIEMSDGQRYWKTFNNTSVEPDLRNVDTIEKFGGKYYLDNILKRDSVDKKHYQYFRKLLIETDLISFTTQKDGTISFTIDGFIDNCYGIAYCETELKPKTNDDGEIIRWTKIGKNWYAWSTT